jgi:hypothetical protein
VPLTNISKHLKTLKRKQTMKVFIKIPFIVDSKTTYVPVPAELTGKEELVNGTRLYELTVHNKEFDRVYTFVRDAQNIFKNSKGTKSLEGVL